MPKPKSQISGAHEHSRILPRHSRIFLAGHRGMVGSAIHRRLQADKYSDIIIRSHGELDLINQAAVRHFFENELIGQSLFLKTS
jgi:nucleoside-diphosphate-sugar epimerase